MKLLPHKQIDYITDLTVAEIKQAISEGVSLMRWKILASYFASWAFTDPEETKMYYGCIESETFGIRRRPRVRREVPPPLICGTIKNLGTHRLISLQVSTDKTNLAVPPLILVVLGITNIIFRRIEPPNFLKISLIFISLGVLMWVNSRIQFAKETRTARQFLIDLLHLRQA